jgi:tRNA-splicing ligase RtcB
MMKEKPTPTTSLPITVFGEADRDTMQQIERCAADPRAVGAALMADNHKGYSMPIGGVVAYRNAVSPSGAGYDIGCGLRAVCTNLMADDVRPDLSRILDMLERTLVFGLGQASKRQYDHPLFDDPAWKDIPHLAGLKKLAREQLSSIGSGNHFVDLLEDEAGRLWVVCHFGSRGLGHKIASGYLALGAGRDFGERTPDGMDIPPTVFDLGTWLGDSYLTAMELAGRYAYAGRGIVIQQVLDVLSARALDAVENHHNYIWRETHQGEEVMVVRKGATPNHPGQRSVVGGSMGDITVILEGVESEENQRALQSTIHGAGRVMSRTQAAGRTRWRRKDGKRVKEVVKPGKISREMMMDWLKREGVLLRGGSTDESPHVYRRLPEVLTHHQGSVRVLHRLKPLAVLMAGDDVLDPYRD